MGESVPSRENKMCKGMEKGMGWNILGGSGRSARLDMKVTEGGEGVRTSRRAGLCRSLDFILRS